MSFKPVHDRVVLKRIKVEDVVSAGGIALPGVDPAKPAEATVVSVGPGKRTNEGLVLPMTVKAGDRVLYQKNAGQLVKVNGEEYLVVKEDEIYAVVDGDSEL